MNLFRIRFAVPDGGWNDGSGQFLDGVLTGRVIHIENIVALLLQGFRHFRHGAGGTRQAMQQDYAFTWRLMGFSFFAIPIRGSNGIRFHNCADQKNCKHEGHAQAVRREEKIHH
jgi:hypothetical protein